MTDDLQSQVERDLTRTRRWDRAYGVFLGAVGLLAALALGAFYAYREWMIWP